MLTLLLPLAIATTPATAQAADDAAEVVDEAVEAEAPAAAPVTYTLQAEPLDLYVLVRYDRKSAAAALGHDHVVSPTSFQGTVTWDPTNIAACDVNISFPVNALVVDPPGARARAGLDGDTSDNDKEKIKSNFSGKNQLDASNYPSITFASTSCTGTGTTAAVTGKLTMRGTSKTVTANMTVNADGSKLSAKGSFTASHADFGFSPFSAILGTLKNDEALSFSIDVEGAAQ